MSGIESLEKQMSLFHNIFLVCLVLFLIFLILDILLFWKFRIDRVFGYLTGKTAKKTIEQMEKSDLESGKLDTGKKKKKKQLSPTKEKSRKKTTVMTPSGQMKMPGTDQVMLSAGTDITDVLEGISPTDPITIPEEQESPVKSSNRYGRFDIIKEVILIHTEEQI